MAGITAIGAYIPRYRLSLEEVAGFWSAKGAQGEKAVAGYDEDSITMAVAAGRHCMGLSREAVDGLYLATTTAPYREKQGAAIVASALDLKRNSLTSDFTNSLRAGSIALKSALAAVESGAAGNIMVAASDCRPAAPKGRLEQLLGDGAAAVSIGSRDTIADIESSYSIFSDFTDLWRTVKDDYVQSAEGRFIDTEGYMPIMQEAIAGLMKQCAAGPGDFAKIVFHASDLREHMSLSKKLGFAKDQVQDPLFAGIGNTGTAASLIMLAAALEDARPGDRILFAGYGDGCDAIAFRVTDAIEGMRSRIGLKNMLAKTVPVDYGKYLLWRDFLTVEASSLPQRVEPSIISRWRERSSISALYGVRCLSCGTPQLHPIGDTIRICAVCQAKDNFEDYRFSDRKGKLFSYAIDQLQPTLNPPGLNGVVDFDGGGRLICELTDYDLDNVAIGMPVEMTFRKMYQGKGIVNYFWKAKPTG
jgi:hydroxymethylglutaryl-CoA synthase